MKKIFVALFILQFSVMVAISQSTPEKIEVYTEHLTLETFKEKVFDFENHKEWKYEGNMPAIVDFYADWCGPCRIIAPILEELAAEYKGKVKIYKVNTQHEMQLSQMLGIKSLPSLLLIPMNGDPQLSLGALPKYQIEEAIKNVLKVEK